MILDKILQNIDFEGLDSITSSQSFSKFEESTFFKVVTTV